MIPPVTIRNEALNCSIIILGKRPGLTPILVTLLLFSSCTFLGLPVRTSLLIAVVFASASIR